MMDLIKQFIERNIGLIEQNEWEEIYKKASDELKDNTGRFTEILLEANIHPENYIIELPKYFLCKSTIKEFIIPNGVISIGNFAFESCASLKSMTIPDSVTIIGGPAFYKCTSLTSVIIGNSVTSIGDEAFAYCTSLTSVTIPDSVTLIKENAFYGCKYLNITYMGTKEQWKNISKGNFSGTTYTCNCIDGVIKKSR